MWSPKMSLGTMASVLPAVLAVCALSGCGGSSGKNSAESSAIARVGRHRPSPPPKAATYQVALGPFPGGDPTGAGVAIIGFKVPGNQLCWTISSLTNVPSPTEVRLFQNFVGASGRNGYRLGHGYKPSGCIPVEAAVIGRMDPSRSASS